MKHKDNNILHFNLFTLLFRLEEVLIINEEGNYSKSYYEQKLSFEDFGIFLMLHL